jgi:hypothetical protein
MPNSAEAQSHLRELSLLDGVNGVALVESESGMVWFTAAKSSDFGPIAEIAVESWRTKSRHAQALAALGRLRLTATHFDNGTLITAPVGADRALLLVGWIEGGKLQITQWREHARAVAAALRHGKA